MPVIILNSYFLRLECRYTQIQEECKTPQNTVSFSKDDFSQGAEYQVFFGVFLMFLAFFHSIIWAQFHLGTFEPYDKEKNGKISSSKKVRFQGWLQMAQFWLTEFLGLQTLGSIISDILSTISQILILSQS